MSCHWHRHSALCDCGPRLNPKQREVSWLNGKVVYSCVTCNVIPSTIIMKRALDWNNYQKHYTLRMRNWWKKLKNHESNLYSSEKHRKLGKKQQLSQHQICCQNIRHQRFVAKTSDIKNFSQIKHQIWCENIRSGNTDFRWNLALTKGKTPPKDNPDRGDHGHRNAGVPFSDSAPVPNFFNPVRLFFKFENPTPVQTPATIIDPTVIYSCFYIRNGHTDSCYCRNGNVTPDPCRVFY